MKESNMTDKCRTTEHLSARLARGMEMAVERCLLDKVVKGQSVVYGHDDGTVYSMSARDALDHFLREREKGI